MVYSVKGRNVLVTGGSRGLGALICEKFAEEGSNVMVNYVSAEDKANEVVKSCQQRGVKAYAIKGVGDSPRVMYIADLPGCRLSSRQRSLGQRDRREARWSRHHHRERWMDEVFRLQRSTRPER